mgnify:CR=1 FL=1
MKPASLTSRHPKRGVVLIATLLSLVLFTGLVSVLQSRTFASARVLSKLTKEAQISMDRASLREMSRPLIGEAMLANGDETALRLNGKPFETGFRGNRYSIVVQDAGGLVNPWRTPRRAAELLLTEPQLAIWQSLRETRSAALPLRQQAARLGLDAAPAWLTADTTGRRLNRPGLSVLYADIPAASLARFTTWRQPRTVFLKINEVSNN